MKSKNIISDKAGFTLLEILLVVAAIAILAGIVIVAINPTKQLGDTRNAQRWSDATTILNAVYQYAIDNNGTLPSGITGSATAICSTTGSACATAGFVDLGVLTTDEKYIVDIPVDPQCATTSSSCYTIEKTNHNRVTVSATDAEQSMTIEVTR